MAEEKKYIPYGLDEVDFLEFLTASADGVMPYLSKQPWSKSRKEEFLKIYTDLMERGVTGASNTSGIWTVNHNGDPFPLDTYSKKAKEMAGEVAYYLQQTMSKLTPRVKEKEEEENKKKENLQLFNNDFFTKDFNTYIGNQLFGGIKWDTQKHWNVLDERGENGLRGRKKRAAKLAELLDSYSNSLQEGKYNFENTPFKDLNDLKARIGKATLALRTESPDDDRDALLQIGLDPDVYFYDGSADETTDAEGNPITYAELAKKNAELAKIKAADELKKALAELNARRGVLNPLSGIHGTDAATNPEGYAEWIASLLGTGLLGYNLMNAAIQGLLNKAVSSGYKLDNNDKRRLGNFLYYIRKNNPNYQKSNITDLEWTELNKFHNLGSTNRAGFVRLPWQTLDGRYTYADDKGNVYFLKPTDHLKFNAPAILRSAAYNNYKNNFLKGPNLIPRGNGVELTTADYVDLGALAADVISLVNPEPISAGILGAGAGIARATNADWDNHFWKSLGISALDVGTGAIGALPVLGDSAIAAKILKNLAKYGKYISYYIAANNLGPAKQAWDKIDFSDPSSFKKLTPDDYRALYNVLQGMVAGRHAVSQNIAGRRALQHRGYEVSNRIDKRLGLTSTKAKEATTLATVRVKIGDKEHDIALSSTSKEKLTKRLKEAGNDVKKLNDALKEIDEVKAVAKDAEVSLVSRPKKYLGYLKSMKGVYGKTSTDATHAGKDDFDEWLKNRSMWSRMAYSNRTLKALDPGSVPKATTAPEAGTSKPELPEPPKFTAKDVGLPSSTNIESYYKNAVGLNKSLTRKAAKRFLNKDTEYSSSVNFGSDKLNIHISKEGELNISNLAGTVIASKKLNKDNFSFDAKKQIGETIEKYRNLLISGGNLHRKLSKEFIESIRDLKRKGFLYKQGGQINKSSELIITEFINS